MTRLSLTTILLTGVILASCSSSQKFQAPATEDKPLFSAINELNKHPENQQAKKDVATFYPQAVQRHEEAIAVYQTGTTESKWDKILKELNALQHIYTSITATPAISGTIEVKNYLQELQDLKEEAASFYYSKATALMQQNNRESYLDAYEILKKVKQYVGNYKDVSSLMNEAYENSVVNVVINPIQDNSVFFAGWGGVGQADFRYRAEDYQQSLVRELGGTNASVVPARFYTDLDMRRGDINADWAVDMSWRNLDALRSVPHSYTRQVSANIQSGTDTAGKAIYKKVYATIHITQRTYTVRGDLDYKMIDLDANHAIDQGLLSDEVSWTDTYAKYTGDARALSQDDRALINNSRINYSPSRGEVLNSLMRKIYPDLRRRIQNAAS
jgi:hypothetical protein